MPREPTILDRADTLLVLVLPMFDGNAHAFADLAARHRIPVMYPAPAFVAAGGLIHPRTAVARTIGAVLRAVGRRFPDLGMESIPGKRPKKSAPKGA